MTTPASEPVPEGTPDALTPEEAAQLCQCVFNALSPTPTMLRIEGWNVLIDKLENIILKK